MERRGVYSKQNVGDLSGSVRYFRLLQDRTFPFELAVTYRHYLDLCHRT